MAQNDRPTAGACADLDLQLRPGIDGGEHAVGRLAVLDGVACQRQLGEFVDPDRVAVG